MNRTIPERFHWALAALAPRPAEHILEIGCGNGVAAELILQRLDAGRLTAIDRSTAAIGKTRQRNRDAVASGRLHLLATPLAGAEFGGARFDQALAINVNAFWTEPPAQLATLDTALEPGGRLHLIYQPPDETKLRSIAERCSAALEHRGYRNIEIHPQPSAAVRGVRISARR